MKMIEFFAYGMPKTQGSMRGFVNKKNGRVMLTHNDKKTVPWRDTVAQAAMKAMHDAKYHELWLGSIRLECWFYLPRPKADFDKNGLLKKEAPENLNHIKQPDSDKLLRAVMDALKGIVYRDDSQVNGPQPWKVYLDNPGGMPGALIIIKEV